MVSMKTLLHNNILCTIMFLVPLRPHQLSLLQPLDEPGVDGPHYTTVADRQQKSHQPGTSPVTNNEMFYKLRNISNVHTGSILTSA